MNYNRLLAELLKLVNRASESWSVTWRLVVLLYTLTGVVMVLRLR
jgi:hypothetical protein